MARRLFKGWFLKAPRVPVGPFSLNFSKRGLSSVTFKVKHGKQSASWTIWSRTQQTGLSSLNGPSFLNYQRNMPKKKQDTTRHDEEGSVTVAGTIGAFLAVLLKGVLAVVGMISLTVLALMADIM